MKRRINDLTKKQYIVTLDALYTAASSVKGRDAVKLFLRDLLTPSERIMLGRRIIIARLLLKGERYEDIEHRMRVSRRTIAKVDRWLHDQFPGYEIALREAEKIFEERSSQRTAEPYTYAWLKRKYPLHFMLFPALKRKKLSADDVYG